MEAGFRREGTFVYLWLIHVVVWQKPTQYCKAIILQLKKREMAENKTKGQLLLMTISVVVSFIKYSELQVSKNSYLYASIFCFF